MVYSQTLLSDIISSSFNDRWLMILEVVKHVNQEKYTFHAGRVIFERICYVLTRNGIQTGFAYVKGPNGPYSKDINKAITTLSNLNLMTEKQIAGSKTIEIHVADDFRLHYDDYPKEELKGMETCIDLFCRIKDINHAEMISTVMFEYDEQKKKSHEVSELDVLNGVLEWRKGWAGKKEEDIKTTIRDLAMLKLIKPVQSFEIEDIY